MVVRSGVAVNPTLPDYSELDSLVDTPTELKLGGEPDADNGRAGRLETGERTQARSFFDVHLSCL